MHAKLRSVGIPCSRQWNQVIDTTRSEDSPLAAEESTCARPYNRNRTENRTIHDHYGYVYLSRWPRHAAGEGRAVTPDGLSAVQRARSKSSP